MELTKALTELHADPAVASLSDSAYRVLLAILSQCGERAQTVGDAVSLKDSHFKKLAWRHADVEGYLRQLERAKLLGRFANGAAKMVLAPKHGKLALPPPVEGGYLGEALSAQWAGAHPDKRARNCATAWRKVNGLAMTLAKLSHAFYPLVARGIEEGIVVAAIESNPGLKPWELERLLVPAVQPPTVGHRTYGHARTQAEIEADQRDADAELDDPVAAMKNRETLKKARQVFGPVVTLPDDGTVSE